MIQIRNLFLFMVSTVLMWYVGLSFREVFKSLEIESYFINLIPLALGITTVINFLITVLPIMPVSSEKESEEEGNKTEIKTQEKPHRQTYLEYVKERLEVERLMRKY